MQPSAARLDAWTSLIQSEMDLLCAVPDSGWSYRCPTGRRAAAILPLADPVSKEMAMELMSLVECVKLFRLSSRQDMTVGAAESILPLFIDALIRVARQRESEPPAA
jgi:hypothetical protein